MKIRTEWMDYADTNLYFTKEETLNSVKENFNIRRFHSAEGYTVSIDNVQEQVIVQDHHNPINESDVDKKLLLPMDSIAVTGSYVVYRDEVWMINSNINIVDDGYKSCQIQYCNWVLKFQSPDGAILSYPCITSNKSFNQDENKVITLGSNEKSILLPYDENTALLNTGGRMYVDKRVSPTPYEIIGDIDTTSLNYGSKGLIYFIMEQDLKQNNTQYPDRPDLGICNYKEPSIIPDTPVGNTYATIAASEDLIIGSYSYVVLTPTFYNADGTVNSSVSAVWTYDYPVSYQNNFTIVHEGNNAKVKVAEVYELIGEKLRCHVSDGNDGYNGMIELTIESGW